LVNFEHLKYVCLPLLLCSMIWSETKIIGQDRLDNGKTKKRTKQVSIAVPKDFLKKKPFAS
jgi:hypothetical protein